MSRLTRDDWAGAALEALSGGGLAAVAVEPLATRLHATKGSFYWHFRGRDDLIAAALELWRQAGTVAVIEALEGSGTPAQTKIRRLFTQVFARHTDASADLALLASADHPLVAPVLAAVTRQRLDYVTALFRDLGHAEEQAARRALFAYSAFLGQLQLRRTSPDLLPSPGPEMDAYVDTVLATLIG